ncbi:MAG TPA: CvpA family protein [Patescibacteria group bacterium]
MFDFNSLLLKLHLTGLGLNLLDLIILVVIIFYAYEGYALGFTLAMADLLSFILSFIVALKLYPIVTKPIVFLFSLPLGFANAAIFLLLALFSEIIIGLVFRRLFRLVALRRLPVVITNIYKTIDHWLGFIPGIISAFIVLSFLLTVIVSLPSSPLIKNLVTNSKIGSQLLSNTSFFENRLNRVFGGALTDTLNFMTVKSESTESVSLHFKMEQGTVDEQAEEEMFQLVNNERSKAGLAVLTSNSKLRDLGRAHSQDMFSRGYFSHYTPDGLSPFDRMDQSGVKYNFAGENLALAPNTVLAMLGLMNSTGHRANILNPNFKQIGIGIVDGGIYGKMYSQEFTD